MKDELDIKEVINNKNDSINNFNSYLDTCIMQDKEHLKKANLLSHWIRNYTDYLQREETFNSSFLKEYSRGDIIKVNLGFNVGNEEGGLHYCVVLDKKNAKSYSTLTVVPLSSQKPSKKQNKTSVFLGDDIYEKLYKKYTDLSNEIIQRIDVLEIQVLELNKLPEITDEQKIVKNFKIEKSVEELLYVREHLNLIDKIKIELDQMKSGSIALVNQITTISKLRIYNPKRDLDILSGIKLSDEQMQLIDEKIKKLFIS